MSTNDVEAILNSLTKKQNRQLLFIIHKNVRSKELAMDCLQEAYRLALENPDGIKKPDCLFMWLKTVAVRMANERMDRYYVLKRKLNSKYIPQSPDPYEAILLKIAVSQEISRISKNWTKVQKDVLYYRYTKRMSFKEIGAIMDISPGNARQINHRILQELKEIRIFLD